MFRWLTGKKKAEGSKKFVCIHDWYTDEGKIRRCRKCNDWDFAEGWHEVEEKRKRDEILNAPSFDEALRIIKEFKEQNKERWLEIHEGGPTPEDLGKFYVGLARILSYGTKRVIYQVGYADGHGYIPMPVKNLDFLFVEDKYKDTFEKKLREREEGICKK
jgi:hypothetical protein